MEGKAQTWIVEFALLCPVEKDSPWSVNKARLLAGPGNGWAQGETAGWDCRLGREAVRQCGPGEKRWRPDHPMEDVWALRVETVRGSWEKPGLRGLSGGGPCSELGKRETKMGGGGLEKYWVHSWACWIWDACRAFRWRGPSLRLEVSRKFCP